MWNVLFQNVSFSIKLEHLLFLDPTLQWHPISWNKNCFYKNKYFYAWPFLEKDFLIFGMIASLTFFLVSTSNMHLTL